MKGVNLIPAHRQAAHQRHRHLSFWIGGLLAHLAILLGICLAVRIVFGLVPEEASAAANLVQTRSRLGQMKEKLAHAKRLRIEVESSRQALVAIHDKPDWSTLLTILGSQTGKEIFLREIQLRSLASTGAGDGLHGSSQGVAVELKGFGQTQSDVAQFVLRLQELKLFDSVRLARTAREPVLQQTAVGFDLTCVLGDERLAGGPP